MFSFFYSSDNSIVRHHFHIVVCNHLDSASSTCERNVSQLQLLPTSCFCI